MGNPARGFAIFKKGIVMVNRFADLIQRAEEAVGALFSCTDVTREETAEALEELRDDINGKIDSLDG